MNKNTKQVVYKILENDEYARKNDLYLIQQTLIQMLPCNQGTAFAQVLQGMKYHGISFGSITRYRRKFLELHPELKDAKTEKARREEEVVYKEEYSHGGYTC